jgi:AraC-like DNA-binding protein/Tfp pilus assembly protein PilF
MRTLVLSVLFFLLQQAAFGQNRELDSLYNVLQNHPQEDTTRVLVLFKICYAELNTAPEKTKLYAEEALNISQKIAFRRGVAGSYRYISDYYWITGDYGKATEFAYNSLRENEAISNTRGIARSYQALGRINVYSKGDFEKSVSLYMKALEYFEKANSKIDIGFTYNSLGGVYIEEKKYDQALSYYLKALDMQKEFGNPRGLAQAYSNLAQVYKDMKRYAEAMRYFELALPLDQERADHYHLATVYAGLGELYTQTADYTRAESYFFRSLDEAKTIGNKPVIEQIYTLMARLEHARNRFSAKADYLELRAQYRDSIYNEQRTKQMAELETRFEVEKKNQEIALLERDQEIKLLWINILIASVFLVLILSTAIYFHQRYRERKDRQILNLEIDNLTTQQKEMSERYRRILTAGTETPGNTLDQSFLKKVIQMIDENIDNPRFGVEELADKVNMSRTNLHRKIKAITNFPTSELIRTIRLRKAAELLLNQVDTVSQVGLMVGFDDHSYFSKSFRKQFGVSPSEYVKSLNTQKPEKFSPDSQMDLSKRV